MEMSPFHPGMVSYSISTLDKSFKDVGMIDKQVPLYLYALAKLIFSNSVRTSTLVKFSEMKLLINAEYCICGTSSHPHYCGCPIVVPNLAPTELKWHPISCNTVGRGSFTITCAISHDGPINTPDIVGNDS
jgi:hypothetical protein